MNDDFNKYAKEKINGVTLDNYFKHLQKKNLTTSHLIESDGIPTDIFSKLINDRIIFICDELDFDVCNIVKAQLLYLEKDSDEDINIYLDCPGGSIYSGMGILDIMDYVSPDIVTINTGLAASMAAVILCSGTKGKRRALKRSRTMIHQPMNYVGYSQASDIEICVKETNTLKKELYEIISEKTGQCYDKVKLDSDRDYWRI